MFFAGAEVLGADVDDAVGVDVEGDLDLGHAAGGGRQANQVELAQRHVVLCELALALEHVNFHRWLIVRRGREGLGAAGGDGRVALDHRGGHTAEGFDAKGQWGHVEQQHVGNTLISSDDAGLKSSAKGDGFVRVDALVG